MSKHNRVTPVPFIKQRPAVGGVEVVVLTLVIALSLIAIGLQFLGY